MPLDCAEGNYVGELIECNMGRAGTGTLQMELVFELLDPQSSTRVGMQRSAFLYFSENARKNSLEKLHRLGFNLDFASPAFDPALTKCVSLVCRHEEWNGRISEKWDLARGPAAPAGQDELRQLNAWAQSMGGAPPRPTGTIAAPPIAPTAPARPIAPMAPPRPIAPTTPTVTAPPKTTVAITNIDEAWPAWVERSQGKSDQSSATRFYAAIEKIAAGRDPSTLRPEDWAKVIDEALPF